MLQVSSFNCGADFRDRSFLNDANFGTTLFNGEVKFDASIFMKICDFRDAKVRDIASFREAKFVGPSDFRRVIFGKKVSFESAELAHVGHFEESVFLNAVPTFRGCKIDETRLEFSGEENFVGFGSDIEEVKDISFLKRLSDEHGQTDQALDFNAMELRAKLNAKETMPSFRLAIWLYGWLSGFGRSYARPLAAYAALAVFTYAGAIGFAAYSLESRDCAGTGWMVLSDLERTDAPYADLKDDKIYLSGYRAAAEYTLYRAAGVLDFSDNGKATDAIARRLFGQVYEPAWG
jgi:hypothetical protein